MPAKFLTILIGFLMILTNEGAGQKHDFNLPPDVAVSGRLVDFPTAGSLERASFNVELDAYAAGGVLSFINIGLHDRFMIGISYGGEGILGDGEADWHLRPEYTVKLRFIDENLVFPAVAVGFESQGTGIYDDELDRYQFKAPGLYLVVSKGYRAYKWLAGIHGGINLNPIEDDRDGDKDPSFFLGFDVTFNRNLTVMCEYQAALNDNSANNPYGRGRGYLNAGFSWTFSDRLQLGFMLKDLLNNTRITESITRELRITYTEVF